MEQASGYAATLPGFRPACGVRRETRGGRVSDQSDDAALVEAARAGRRDAFDLLVVRHRRAVYRVCYRFAGNHEDASDLTQETFIKAFQALQSFKGGSTFFTWLYRIAVNKTMNFLKQRRSRVSMSLNDLDLHAEHDPDLVAFVSERTPRRHVSLAELQEKLNAAMLKLSEVHRLVVTLHDIQGMSHDEIGRIMNCNTGTVRSRLFYARQQLQAYLSDYLK